VRKMIRYGAVVSLASRLAHLRRVVPGSPTRGLHGPTAAAPLYQLRVVALLARHPGGPGMCKQPVGRLLALVVPLALTAAVGGGEKETAVKGELPTHAFALEAGQLYAIRAEGKGFDPRVQARGFFL